MAILASSRTALLSDKIRGVISRPSHRSCFKSCPSVPGGFTCHCSLSFFKISQYQHREERMELEPKRDVTNPPYRHIARAPASGQDLINLLDITAVCLGVCVCLRLEDLMTHKTPLGCSGWNTVMILHLQLTGRPFSQDSGASAKETEWDYYNVKQSSVPRDECSTMAKTIPSEGSAIPILQYMDCTIYNWLKTKSYELLNKFSKVRKLRPQTMETFWLDKRK